MEAAELALRQPTPVEIPTNLLEAPVSDVYELVEKYWWRFKHIFPKSRKLPPPSVLIHDTNGRPGFDKVRETAQVLPGNKYEGLVGRVNCWALKGGYYDFIYDPQEHAVFINRNKVASSECFADLLGEEVTHAATHVNGSERINISGRDVASLNALGPVFRDKIVKMLGDQDQPLYLPVNVNEFFPPIGQTFIGVYGGHDWNGLIDKYFDLLEQTGNPRDYGLSEYKMNLVIHLPQIAGELLVRQYGDDVEALIKDHNEILGMDAYSLWSRYCQPLLKNGRI